MSVQWRRVWAKLFAEAKKRRRGLLAVLLGTTLTDFVLGHYREELASSLLPDAGRVGKLAVQYPFALLAVVLIAIGVWLAYIALHEIFGQVESPIVGPRKEKLYSPPFDPKFLALFTIAAIVFPGVCIQSIVRHYQDPLPNVVALRHAWFARDFRKNDLYIVTILKNYSDVAVPVHIETGLWIFKEPIPTTEEQSPSSVTIPPWEEYTVRREISFKKDSQGPDIEWAFAHNGFRVGLETRYNNGKRDVTFHYLGLLIGDHYDPQLEGQIIVLKDDTD